MKRYLLASLCFSFGLSACQQASGPARPPRQTPALAGPAKIACTAPRFDFKEVDAGTEVSHVFRVRNLGGAALELKGTKAG